MISIDKKLLDEISSYCKLNNIKEMSIFATELLRKAFMIEKYGERPGFIQQQPLEKTEEIKIEKVKPEIVKPEVVNLEKVEIEAINNLEKVEEKNDSLEKVSETHQDSLGKVSKKLPKKPGKVETIKKTRVLK